MPDLDPSCHRQPASTQEAPMLTDPQFITVAEAASLLRVSKMTVYRLCHSGELEAIRVGRSFRIPALALTAYINGSAIGENSAHDPQ
jgi:excisionase family DNA binding protein